MMFIAFVYKQKQIHQQTLEIPIDAIVAIDSYRCHSDYIDIW